MLSSLSQRYFSSSTPQRQATPSLRRSSGNGHDSKSKYYKGTFWVVLLVLLGTMLGAAIFRTNDYSHTAADVTIIKQSSGGDKDKIEQQRQLLRGTTAITDGTDITNHNKEPDSEEKEQKEEEEEYYYDVSWMKQLNGDCGNSHGNRPKLPLWKQDTFNFMHKAYLQVVGEEAYEKEIGRTIHETEEHGIRVPFYAGYSDERGRGVFTSEPVKKGSLIWTPTQTARFRDHQSYIDFMALLPNDLACDVKAWAYVQDMSIGFNGEPYEMSKGNGVDNKSKPLAISVDMEEGSLLNTRDLDFVEDYTPNIGEQNTGCDPEGSKLLPGGCSIGLFALRDLEADEEIFISYGDFAISAGWGGMPKHVEGWRKMEKEE
jgi:hypothetical protein